MIKPVMKADDNIDNVIPDIVRAAYDANSALVASLIAQGHSVNSVDPRDNLSILHIACLQGDNDLAEVILQRDVTHGDVDFTTLSKYRPRQPRVRTADAHKMG